MNASLLFLAVAFVWMLQLILSLLQTKRFHRRIAELRKMGPATSIGYSGKNWTGKKYGVLVVDDERNVVRAEKLTGFTVFSNLKEVPLLAGVPIDRVLQDEPLTGMKKSLWDAFKNAAEYIVKHDTKEENESEETEEEGIDQETQSEMVSDPKQSLVESDLE